MVVKTYTAKRKPSFKGPPLRSVSIGESDYDFHPRLEKYNGIPAAIAEHLKREHSSEFEITKTRRRKK